jgi:aryl sulfotransferase
MRLLLANIQNADGPPVSINSLEPRSFVHSRRLFYLSTLLDPALLLPNESATLRSGVIDEYIDEQSSPLFAKVHDAWTHGAAGIPLLGRRARAALYLVRDPRDVVVSYAFHNEDRLDAVIKTLNNPAACLLGSVDVFPQQIGDWSRHVRGWRDQTDIPLHVVRYEDLHQDTEQVLRKVVEWLGSGFDSDAEIAQAVSRAVKSSELRELQRQEREKGFRIRPAATLSPDASLFFRQGRIGDWRNHLSLQQVRVIEEAHGETMLALGYQLEGA